MNGYSITLNEEILKFENINDITDYLKIINVGTPQTDKSSDNWKVFQITGNSYTLDK